MAAHHPRRGSPVTVALGFVAGVLVMVGVPAGAGPGGERATGEALTLGIDNTASNLTSLRGAISTSNLRITNTAATGTALDLRVATGNAPLKVNSKTRIANLNADLLDGKHATAFLLLAAYDPDKDHKVSDADLLDGLDSTAFARTGAVCPPGVNLVGYGRTGPICGSTIGTTTLDSIGEVGRYSSLVLDPAGRPVVAYWDFTNKNLKLVRCGNATCTAGNTVRTLDSEGLVGQYSSLKLDAAGFPVVSYYDESNGALKLIHCGDATCEAGNTTSIVDTEGNTGRFTSLALDRLGFPVIAYHNLTTGSLRVAHCGNATCSSGNVLQTVDTSTIDLWPSIVLDAVGRPVISYHANNRYLKVVHCGNETCGSGNVFSYPAGFSETVGWTSSLLLDPAGIPVISYHDHTNGDLKLARCSDVNCATGTVVATIDGADNVGSHTSMVLGLSGYPIIAYADNTNLDLKLAWCGDRTCSAGNIILTVDGPDEVGGFASLATDAGGNLVIAYRDETNFDLKLAMVVG